MNFTEQLFFCGKCDHEGNPKKSQLHVEIENGDVIIKSFEEVGRKGLTPHILFWDESLDYQNRHIVHCYCGVCGVRIIPYGGDELDYLLKVVHAPILLLTDHELQYLLQH